jgi:hypothetical protein
MAMLGMLLAKALRWSAILTGVVKLRRRDSIAAIMVGGAGNVILSHLGDLFRVMTASRRSRGTPESLLTSIAVERVFDIAVILPRCR